MPKEQTNKSGEKGFVLRLNLVGLVVFSVSLVLAGGFFSSGFSKHPNGKPAKTNVLFDDVLGEVLPKSDTPPSVIPPWGELLVRDIELERPEEYIAFEIASKRVSTWVFEQMSPEQVRQLMLTCGLEANQVERALSPALASATNSGTVIKPDAELLFSLSPEIRGKLYRELARFPTNRYMVYPYYLQGNTVHDWFKDTKLDPEIIAKVEKLIYPRGQAKCFSDFEIVLKDMQSEQVRIEFLKALSRQPGLLVRLRVRPDSDVEKLMGYWSRGISAKDARPLLEALTRIPEGGTMSLLYLLPRFARERLYTFPLPPDPTDPAIDCHWTSMNFFNLQPDTRFSNLEFTATYLRTNFYQVAKANQYGDLVFILNKEGNAVHSAVYLADDIVFTKNGNNYAQPWMLMRIKDMATYFSSSEDARLVYYRNKNS